MKLLLATAAVILLFPAAGPYPITFPVEGLTNDNAGQLKDLLTKRLGKNRDGERILYEVGEVRDGHATIVLGCHHGTSIVNLRAALEGSAFSLKLDAWELYGKFTLYWSSAAALEAETRSRIEERLSSWGLSELRSWEKDKAHHYLARVKLEGKTESVEWRTVAAFLAGHGVKDPELCWDNVPIRGEWVRVECGARRAKSPPRPEMSRFLIDAVTEGLAADGAEPDLVSTLLNAPEPGLFVVKCPVCRPVEKAMQAYAKAGVAGPGKGWPEALKADIRSGDRDRMMKALEEIVTRYVDAKFTGLRLSPADEKHLKIELAEGRKIGMSVKREDFGDRCPSCEGAN